MTNDRQQVEPIGHDGHFVLRALGIRHCFVILVSSFGLCPVRASMVNYPIPLNPALARPDTLRTRMTLEERLYHAIVSRGPVPSADADSVVVTHAGTVGRLTRADAG